MYKYNIYVSLHSMPLKFEKLKTARFKTEEWLKNQSSPQKLIFTIENIFFPEGEYTVYIQIMCESWENVNSYFNFSNV